MQVASDPVALLGDGQPPCLTVEARVVDGDPGVAGEELDEPLVGRRELARADLVGQVEVADRRFPWQ